MKKLIFILSLVFIFSSLAAEDTVTQDVVLPAEVPGSEVEIITPKENKPDADYSMESNKDSIKKNDQLLESSLESYKSKQIDGYFSASASDENPFDPYVSIDETFTLDRAIELALNNNFDLMTQEAALMNASGQLHEAQGKFDIKVGADTTFSKTYTPTDKNNLSARSGEDILYQTVEGQDFTSKAYVEKLFAFGINAKLNFQLQRGKNKYKDGIYALDNYYAQYGHPNYNNTGTLSLEVSVPLLKGFNRAIADNDLKMARENYEAMAYNLEDTISKVIMQTSESYWKFYISYEKVKKLEILLEKNNSRQKIVSSLVRSGVRNKNDMLRIEVNSLDTKRQLETAKIDFNTEKVNLAIQIGIPVEEIANPKIILPEINFDESFPKVEEFTREKMEKIAYSRPDMISLMNACDAAAIKVKNAKTNCLPDLDLKFSLGTNGAAYGDDSNKYFKAPIRNNRGLNYSGTLGFSMPLENNARKGELLQAEGSYAEALAKLNKQKNIFILQLRNSVNSLNSYKDTVMNAKNVLNLQQQVYDNEQKRYEAGISSVDNLLQQDSTWLEANIAYYQIFQTYLKYVMEYKYYTSDLISVDTKAETLYNLQSANTDGNNDVKEGEHEN